MASNVVVEMNPAGNMNVTKARSKVNIDGIVSAIMVLDQRIRNRGKLKENAYEKRVNL